MCAGLPNDPSGDKPGRAHPCRCASAPHDIRRRAGIDAAGALGIGQASMPGLSVHLLGPWSIDNGELPASAPARELACYLLLHRDRPIARTTLAELLWPGQDPTLGLKHLRQALWQLHTAFDRANSAHGDGLFDINPRSVMLRATALGWLDVAEFEAIVNTVRASASRQFTSDEAAQADHAVSLYQGDLLDGYDYDWCIVEREFLRSACLTMLDRLMRYCEQTGEYERGIDYGERVLRVDRAREYTHRRMMYLHAMLGNRTGALRQFDRCAAALADELDVVPAKPTVLLQQLIRSGADLPARSPHHAADFAPLGPERDAAPLDRLHGIQRALMDVQALLQAELGVSER